MSESANTQKIAIIGMSCRFPGADNINEFWENLKNEVESISTFTDDELRECGVVEDWINSPNYIKRRGIINGAEYFDASFFDVTPRDAEIMDPQHRVFLECAWHALEDGGYNSENTDARIGVFGGSGTNWHLNSTKNNDAVKKYASGTSIVTGNDKDYLATRVSYKLNLKGPSLTVQSACSTSMSAIVLGINSLLSYQCDMILAGGSTIELPEKQGYMYQEGGLESSDGHCRTFDIKADGTVFSRGAGVVLLKRYEDAVKDGDNIHAVILGGAINNDGSNKVGFTAPSVEGQVSVAIEAMEISNIDASSISYVEAHGTATNVGDPIEVSSLSQVFETYTDKKQFCAIGSVKTNIGHTDSASGIAGLVKVVMAMKHKKIPAHLNYSEPNPKINFETSPFYVNTSTSDWEVKEDEMRRALVNSFGVGGTNACIIVEESPSVETLQNEKEKLIFLSARNEDAINEAKENLSNFIQKNENLNLSDVAYTLQVGRKSFEQRECISFKTREELLQKLETESSNNKGLCFEDGKPIIFMFPGQGNQYLNMGYDLYQNNDLYKETFDYCCNYLNEKIGLDLREYIFAEAGSEKAKIALEQTYITQPAIFVVSYAMAKIMEDRGIVPEALIGHSVGEYVAACISGIMSLEDALYLVAKRGELVQKLPGGSMLAVLENEDKILPFLSTGVEIAAVNNPKLTVLSGPDEKITELEKTLDNSGFFYKRLDTSHAFHSAMMDPCLPEFETLFEEVELNEPTIPIISTVTGKFLKAEEATDPSYWVKHVRESVRFTDAVKLVLEMNPSVFLEVGPGQSLESSVKRHLDKESLHKTVRTMRSVNESFNDNTFSEEAIGAIWMNGGNINWSTYYKDEKRVKLSLPVYPFQRAAYSIDFSQTNFNSAIKQNTRYSKTENWYSVPSWKRTAHIDMINTTEKSEQVWLLIKDNYYLGDTIEKQLTDSGSIVISVASGETYKKESSNSYIVNLFEKEDFNRLISDIKEDGNSIDNVVYLKNYREKLRELTEDNFNKIEHETFFSILYLMQAFYATNQLKETHLSVVANGTFDIIGGEVYSPENALGVGTCRVLIQEFPKTRATFIDVDLSIKDYKKMALAKNIINETLNDGYDTVVGYRNNYRWVEEFDTVKLAKDNEPNFKDKGVYLITGGLGGIGILTAKTIAEEANVSFVLTYNSPIPARSEWKKWLAENPEESFIQEKIKGVLAIEELGSKVYLYQVNVSDYKGMKALRNDVEEKVGKINGIIHSAGTVGGGIIPLKTAESVRPVFDSKFRGTLVLDRVFNGDKDLDFMFLYSSITSILGEATRLDYCSANAFLDAFSYYRNNQLNSKTTTVNWAGWESIGMAVRWEKTKTEKSNQTKLRYSKDFLKLVKKDETQQIYDVDFNPESDWIINSHFIISQPTVVGTSFLEIIHQYAKLEFPDSTIEMKNLYFISPLMFEKGKNKRVRFVVDLKNGKHKFSFRTQPMEKNPETDKWHDHFMGEIVCDTFKPAPIDLAAIKKRLEKNVDETKSPRLILNAQEEPLIDLGERWDIDNKVYIGEHEWLAELTLREEFEGDVTYFDYHPAMMDKATSFGLRFLSDSTFLPFSYKSIKPFGKLPAKVYAYASVDAEKQNDDAVSIDITMISLEGEVLMEIKQYTMKQVNNLPTSSVSETETKKKKDKAYTSEIDFIHPKDGKEVIKQMLSKQHLPQLIVYPCDFEFMVEDTVPDIKKREEEKERERNATKSYYARPALKTEYEEPETEMEKTITGIWQDILGLDKIGRNDTFTELGGNSLLAIQTIANIVDILDVELTAQVFYDNPTVKGLAEAVIESIIDLSEVENLEGLLESLELEE